MITDETLVRIGQGVELHLNLAECYRKLGDLGRAREHLRHAEAGIGALGDDEYGRLIKGGLDRLTATLGPQPTSGATPARPARRRRR